jgi:N6-L-threonylcarbamoyladenine synthase
MNKVADIFILGIESSCDDTSISVCKNNEVLSNITANQKVHSKFGGVVPELASRAHQENIVPVYNEALKQAGVSLEQINAIAYTHGPGLLGSLLVGCSFAKSLAIASKKPLIAINHMEAHILAHTAKNNPDGNPTYPYLNLTVSGGHTQLVKVSNPESFELIGESIDDAAGEAFDKGAKTLGLPYPGGPHIDKIAKEGDPRKFTFPIPRIGEYEFSFSGIKTSLLYFLQKESKKDENFISDNLTDICASYQHGIVSALLQKVEYTADKLKLNNICVSGGVSANSYLNQSLRKLGTKKGWNVFIPPLSLCTDNGAMIALAGYQKYLIKRFSSVDAAPKSRWKPGASL